MPISVVPYGSTAGASTHGHGTQTYDLTSTQSANQLQTVPGGHNGCSTYSGYGRLQDEIGYAIRTRTSNAVFVLVPIRAESTTEPF